jgi:lipoprotein-anchoring transpeptidase ErfK/SrfK
MKRRSIIAVTAALVALLVLAGAVYAYDAARAERVAEGVTVSGIDVGGLERGAAREKLRRTLLEPLSQPVTATHRSQTFTLSSRAAQVGVDLDGSVAAAIRRSREGNILTRAYRELTGGSVRGDVPVEVTYSRPAIARLVRRVKRKLERKAVNAHVNLEQGDVTPRASKTGLRVRTTRLAREIAARLTSTTGPRTVRVRTGVVQPKVTTAELADKYPAILIVDRKNFTLKLYKKLKPAKTYRIAVGKAGLDTPAGLYTIQNKAENPAWHVPDSDWAGDLAGKVIPPGDPRNPIEARWMAIYDGAGIHGTTADDSIGTAASHGCVRMRIPDVIELYDQVPTGAPVYIA